MKKRRLFPAALVFVVKRGLFAALVALLNASLFVDAASAEIATEASTTKGVVTVSTQAHPKKFELAYLVMENRRIEGSYLEYLLDRWNGGPDLKSGGRMVAALTLITESGTQRIDGRINSRGRPRGGWKASNCENSILEDERGYFNQRVCDIGWDLETDLEPGDVLLWTVKFKGMPDLEFEPYMDTVYRDRFTLSAWIWDPWPDE